ncbi:MAG: carbonic anhydrase [Rhodobacteraceae bacterium HLUCCO07]|nr:MAG: carbonic anhydrase [Rhodobacteraceae bacterium HLUCCO07]
MDALMHNAKPLPSYLANRYHGWKATTYKDNAAWYHRLADEGQHPRAMVISCCDSRVHVTSIFGADQGEFFIHRNIANLVPPYQPDGQQHGTSAAVEFAVTALKVAHVIVIGHSSCGGAKGCHDMCAGHAPELEEKTSFLGRWLDILRPGYERIKDMPEQERMQALEKQAVLVSLENLMTFPFVKSEVESDHLSLHGLWHDIGEGLVEHYLPEIDAFRAV